MEGGRGRKDRRNERREGGGRMREGEGGREREKRERRRGGRGETRM